jgi:hypothetical protein
VIRLGLRLAVSSGREAVVRLVIVAAPVGVGVGPQNDRYAWLDTGAITRYANVVSMELASDLTPVKSADGGGPRLL